MKTPFTTTAFCESMSKKIHIIVFLLCFPFITQAQNPKPVPGQYIVVLKESVAMPVIKKQKKNNNREQKFNDNKPERDKNLAKLKEVRQKKNIKESSVLLEYADVTVGFSAKLTDKEKKDLEADPDVEEVYQDYYVELPPNLEVSSIDPVDGSNLLESAKTKQYVGCNITKAGGPAASVPRNTCIWIMDTGIDMDHPDLNVETNPKLAKSFVPYQSVEDGHGHGTHCAGIAAAKNNSMGVVGTSPGATVVPVKVLSNYGPGQFSWLLAGLNHVAMYDIPGDVINMSHGTDEPISNCLNFFPMAREAIIAFGNAGTWVVISAGNDGSDANNQFPGCINGTRILTVGSIDCRTACSSFSNFSPAVVDWVAIGTSVYSTYKNGGYATLSGTSMATPAVAGIVHSKNGQPNSGGTVLCQRFSYKIAIR